MSLVCGIFIPTVIPLLQAVYIEWSHETRGSHTEKRHNWNFPVANRISWNFTISYLFVFCSMWKLIIQKISLWISDIKKLPLTILIPNNILKISTIPPTMVHFYFTSITLFRSKCCIILHILSFFNLKHF